MAMIAYVTRYNNKTVKVLSFVVVVFGCLFYLQIGRNLNSLDIHVDRVQGMCQQIRTDATINELINGIHRISQDENKALWETFYLVNDVRKQHSFKSQIIPALQPHLDEELRAPIVEFLQLLENNGTNADSLKMGLATGITSKGIKTTTLQNMTLEKLTEHFQFFDMFSSFCKTASTGYFYHFYLAFDINDSFFVEAHNQQLFLHEFLLKAKELCFPNGILTRLHLVWCRHKKMSAWAHNDATMEAYWDNVEHVYRILDDTKMITKGWAERFLGQMKSYTPENVGVAGPNHTGGNTRILVLDFVHKTHIDIFGFYFPRVFRGKWYLYMYINFNILFGKLCP